MREGGGGGRAGRVEARSLLEAEDGEVVAGVSEEGQAVAVAPGPQGAHPLRGTLNLAESQGGCRAK